MSVKLSEKDRQMIDGEQGEATRLAMSVLVKMAGVYGAEEMMDVTQAHIDGCGLMSESSLEFAETLAAMGGQVSIPTTLNMIPLDLQYWAQFGVPGEFAARATRLAQAYIDMGCVPTFTCAPYQGYLTPRFGQQIAWAESNAIVYANSVLGARTNRYGDFVDICAAIAGRVPRHGLHLKQNRKGQILLRLVDIHPAIFREDASYSILGHLIGSLVEDKIPVIQGLPADASGDQLKALGAASASSGAVALFHAIGVTPEANTLDEAFQGGAPERVIDIHLCDLAAARAELSTTQADGKLDWVILGCPHFSFAEFQHLTKLIQSAEAESIHPDVEFIIFSSQTSYSLLQRSDLMNILTAFGVRITLDTCPFHTPMVPPDVKVIMTNSGKCAYYAPGELDVQVVFGTIADCVCSAISGHVRREEALWTES